MIPKLSMMAQASYPITWEVEVRGSKLHGGPRLYIEFKTILDYMKPHHINK